MDRCPRRARAKSRHFRRARSRSAQKSQASEVRSAAPRTWRAAGLTPEPAGKIIWIVEAGARRRFGDGGFAAEGGLRGFEPHAIPQRAEAEAGFPFEFSI